MMTTPNSLRRLVVGTAVTLAILACGAVEGQQRVGESGDWVMLVELVYEDGTWKTGPGGVRVLPCSPPNPMTTQRLADSIVRLMDESGEMILEQNIRNPRIRLAEPEAEGPIVLEKATVTLRLPAIRNASTLDYFDPAELPGFAEGRTRALETARGEMEPSITVNVGGAIRAYEDQPVARGESPCREFVYKPDQLK
jgi:hypothetical protein